MTILSHLFTGHETGDVLIPMLEIYHPSFTTIRTCSGYESQTVILETGEQATFPASGLGVSWPPRDATGQQNLSFAVNNVTGIAQSAIRKVLADETSVPVRAISRLYLASDLSEPAQPPLKMDLVSAEFKGVTMQAVCSHMEIINYARLRDRYTAGFAPGLKYIG